MAQEPQKGEYWEHFKGGVYEILEVAEHTETNEFLVVYRNVQPPCRT